MTTPAFFHGFTFVAIPQANTVDFIWPEGPKDATWAAVDFCSLLVMSLVILQISDPHNNMVLTLELKTLSLVLSVICLVFQILFNMLKVLLAFPILAFTSSSVPSSTEIYTFKVCEFVDFFQSLGPDGYDGHAFVVNPHLF